jgi:hypothetical protein
MMMPRIDKVGTDLEGLHAQAAATQGGKDGQGQGGLAGSTARGSYA